jgi:predicted flap endonuclease-1-like 5' DNA nuclease
MTRRNALQAMDSPLGGMALGIGFVAQAQPEPLGGVPTWLFIVAALVVIVFAVAWVLHEEAEATQKQAEAPETLAADQVAEPPPPAQPDDLTLIEGIGPKISGLLQAAGITTFAQLAAAEVSRLRQLLMEAGLATLADPTTWPEQASLAADGDWETLKALQDQLKGGRQA